ncbi:MAG TPA: DUF1080 domain-containing protein [Verrucomicrobiae bacterium]|nr:DUF1080 domain-containing protein [Verrucomicrobiae bacterium]
MKSFPIGYILRTVMLIFGVATFPVSAQPNQSPVITPTNEIALFDGKSFSGWTFISQGTNALAVSIWSVTNGVIVCQGRPNGYARTLQKYRDYQLHAEWRYPDGAGNSGIFLHLNPPDQVWPFCFEAQLLSGSAGEVRMNGGSKAEGLTAQHPLSMARRQASSEKPLGEWNACDIVCRANTITVHVNGVLQNEVTGTSAASGTIGLQAEGKLVEFRNLVLEPLP